MNQMQINQRLYEISDRMMEIEVRANELLKELKPNRWTMDLHAVQVEIKTLQLEWNALKAEVAMLSSMV